MILLLATITASVITPVTPSEGREANQASGINTLRISPIPLLKSEKGNARSQFGCCGGGDASENPHLLAGTYYTVTNGYSATLLLNNKGPAPIRVQPTLFSLEGERFNVPVTTVGANTHRFVDLQEWVALAGAQFREGSIQLFHRGKDLVLGTQIYLTDGVHSLSFDEKLTELGSGGQRLEGVWWLPSPRGTINVAISNTTDSAICAVVNVEGESPRKAASSAIELGPHETRLLDLETEVLHREHGAMSQYGAISVSHEGTPGAVLARAMAFEQSKGYSLPVQFSNPAAGKSSNLQGTGLRIAPVRGGSLSGKLVVHNSNQSPQTVSGTVPFTLADGSTAIAQLPSLEMSAGDTRVIDISQLLRSEAVNIDQVASAGVELQHTGRLGTLITSAFAVSDSGDQVFRMPIWDIAAQRSATGGYPWYINGDSSTVVYIKNTTDQSRQFRLYIMYESGGYLYPLTTVPPHQTHQIDVRALRDNQVPDANGNKLPLSIAEGQIEWSMTGGEDRVMIGRSEQVDFVKGISSNYACMNCCGNSFYDAWITPTEAFGLAGDQLQFQAMQQDANCYGQPFLPYPRGTAFANFISSICQSDPSGSTTMIAPGQTTIQWGWQADSWISWGGSHGECEYSPVDVLRDALCDVVNQVVLNDVTVFERGARFGYGNIANLSLKGSAHESDTCGSNAASPFEIRVHFRRPLGATLVPERCNAEPYGDLPEWIVVGPTTCTTEGGNTGRLVFQAYRAISNDNNPLIKVFVGADDQDGHRVDATGTVHLTCSQ